MSNPTEGDWAVELGPLAQGDIELMEDAIEGLLQPLNALQRDSALHGLQRRVEAAKSLAYRCAGCAGSGIGMSGGGCADCLGTGADQMAADAMNHAYAEGRKDEAETLSQAARDILAERQRQVESEGYTPAHDDEHTPDDLADAAAAYALVAHFARTGIAASDVWPWDASSFKPRDQRRNYVRAAALMQAAVELIDRAGTAKASA